MKKEKTISQLLLSAKMIITDSEDKRLLLELIPDDMTNIVDIRYESVYNEVSKMLDNIKQSEDGRLTKEQRLDIESSIIIRDTCLNLSDKNDLVVNAMDKTVLVRSLLKQPIKFSMRNL